ncbi:MAG: SurA N-terminal domain-containing protein [Vicinamibacterales bacterium]
MSILLLVALVAGPSGQIPASRAPDLPEIVARVNGVALTRGEFEARLAQSRSMNPERFDRMADAERASAMARTLDDMIVREVQVQEARRRGLVVADEEMAADLEGLAAMARTRGGLDRLLADYGITLDQWKEETRRNLLIRKLERAEAASLSVEDRERQWPARRRAWLRGLVEAADIRRWTPRVAP